MAFRLLLNYYTTIQPLFRTNKQRNINNESVPALVEHEDLIVTDENGNAKFEPNTEYKMRAKLSSLIFSIFQQFI